MLIIFVNFLGGGTLGDSDLDFDGISGTAYFTYVGDYDTSVGFKYMVMDGRLDFAGNSENSDIYLDHDLKLG